MDKKNLEFAALLHDIGKFYQRTGESHDSSYKILSRSDFGQNGAHAKWSADFVSNYWNADIEDLVLHHHAPGNSYDSDLGGMVQKADHHSSAERVKLEEDEKNDVSKSPLISIFSEISIGENSLPEEKYCPLRELNLYSKSFDELKPVSEKLMSGWNLEPEYTDLWKKFSNEINGLNKHNDFNTILALLRKYTSTMPSAAYVSKSNISLYDHSKTTAALANCRFLFKRDGSEKLKKTNNQNVYLIISGDLSGIQNFIFKVFSPQNAQSGMSKRLRGRSLFIALISDAISSFIAKKLELTQANILFCGGGRFTIVAPNTDIAKTKLSEIKSTVNKYFIDNFNAELYLSIVYEESCGELSKDEISKEIEKSNLKDYGKITQKLASKLAEDKKHKFSDDLNDIFNLEEEIIYSDLCSVCGNPYNKSNDDDLICPICKEHENLGQKVANSEYMLKFYSNENKDFKNNDGFCFEPLKIAYFFERSSSKLISKINDLAKNENCEKLEVIKLNDTKFLELATKVDDDVLDKISFSFSFLGNTVPKHDYVPLYFEHLAKISKGANKLGVLKMDVDNLGSIFSRGFKNTDDGRSGISKVSTLSSQMDIFFSGFVNNIASNYKVYSVCGKNKDDFDEIELELQNDDFNDSINKEIETFKVYKKKFGVELSEDDENSLKNYTIPTIHINYSGGDDLLVLGPYDDIISFAQELRSKFKEWTGNNPSINLSAGINIVSPKFPIGKAAIMSEEYLEAAKSCGRNKITLFGEVVNWDSNDIFKGFNDLFEFGQKLEYYVDQNKLSKGIIYSMLYMWQNNFDGYSGIVSDEDKWSDDIYKRSNTKRFVPLFKYKLRLVKDKNVFDNLNKNGIKFMPWIKIPVSWVSLRMR